MTLRALQSAANSQTNKSTAPLTWDAINSIGQRYGSPAIDYDRFSARWDTDPVLKSLVDKFDGQGVTIKTADKEADQQVADKSNEVSKMAKRATKLGK